MDDELLRRVAEEVIEIHHGDLYDPGEDEWQTREEYVTIERILDALEERELPYQIVCPPDGAKKMVKVGYEPVLGTAYSSHDRLEALCRAALDAVEVQEDAG